MLSIGRLCSPRPQREHCPRRAKGLLTPESADASQSRRVPRVAVALQSSHCTRLAQRAIQNDLRWNKRRERERGGAQVTAHRILWAPEGPR